MSRPENKKSAPIAIPEPRRGLNKHPEEDGDPMSLQVFAGLQAVEQAHSDGAADNERLESMKNRVDTPHTYYIRYPVAADGDCGFTAFGITRAGALRLLNDGLTNENRESIIHLLQPAIRGELLTEQFHQYLVAQGALSLNVSLDELIQDVDRFAHDTAIIQGYINYDVRDTKIDAGFAHPGVLQALAHIQRVDLRIWRTGDNDSLIPHEGIDFDYAEYTPPITERRVDILFVHGNHFDLLESDQPEQVLVDGTLPLYPYKSSRSQRLEGPAVATDNNNAGASMSDSDESEGHHPLKQDGEEEEVSFDLYASREIVLQHKERIKARIEGRNQTAPVLVYDYASYERKVLQAIEDGNVRLLEVLLYDGLDFEREFIADFEKAHCEQFLNQQPLLFREKLIDNQIEILKIKKQQAKKNNGEEFDVPAVLDKLKRRAVKKTKTFVKNVYDEKIMGKEDFWYKGVRFKIEEDEEFREHIRSTLERKCEAEELNITLEIVYTFGIVTPKLAIENALSMLQTKLEATRKEMKVVDSNYQRYRAITIVDKFQESQETVYTSEKGKRAALLVLLKDQPWSVLAIDGYTKVNQQLFEEVTSMNIPVDAVDPETGDTLLHKAVQRHIQRAKESKVPLTESPVVSLLMARNAMPFASNNQGKTAFELACDFAETKPDDVLFGLMLDMLNRLKLEQIAPYDVSSSGGPMQAVYEQFKSFKKALDAYAREVKAHLGDNAFWRFLSGFSVDDIRKTMLEFSACYAAITESIETVDIIVLRNVVEEQCKRAHRSIFGKSRLFDSSDMVAADLKGEQLSYTPADVSKARTLYLREAAKKETDKEKVRQAVLLRKSEVKINKLASLNTQQATELVTRAALLVQQKLFYEEIIAEQRSELAETKDKLAAQERKSDVQEVKLAETKDKLAAQERKSDVQEVKLAETKGELAEQKRNIEWLMEQMRKQGTVMNAGGPNPPAADKVRAPAALSQNTLVLMPAPVGDLGRDVAADRANNAADNTDDYSFQGSPR